MKIFVVDDQEHELILINEALSELGYADVTSKVGFIAGREELKTNYYDLLITDFSLDQGKDAVNLLLETQLPVSTGVIVVTNFFEEFIYDKFDKIRPVMFLKKGFSNLELRQAIEFQVKGVKDASLKADIQDKFYVKIGDKLEIVNTLDIEYFEADGKYCNIYLGIHKYNVRASMIGLLKRLPDNFIRIHGSYIINLNKVKSIVPNDNVVELENHTLSFSRTYKKDLLDQFHFI